MILDFGSSASGLVQSTSVGSSPLVRFEAPPAWTGTEEEWHAEMEELVRSEEATLRTERIRTKRPVMGAERVKRQKHTDAPHTREERTSELNPCIATGGDIPLMKLQIVILKYPLHEHRS